MLAILFGAVANPYSIKDKDTGVLNEGVSGKLYFARSKPSKKKRDVANAVGTFTKIVKCDENLAKAAREELTKAGGPIVINVDTEVSGTGANAKEEVIDFEPVGPLNEFTFSFEQGLRRRRAPTEQPALPGVQPAGKPTASAS